MPKTTQETVLLHVCFAQIKPVSKVHVLKLFLSISSGKRTDLSHMLVLH